MIPSPTLDPVYESRVRRTCVQFLCCLACGFLCGASGAQDWVTRGGELRFADSRPAPGKTAQGASAIDIREARLSSDGSSLRLTLRFGRTLASYLEEHWRNEELQSYVALVYFDVDDDVGSGGYAVVSRSLAGFEYQLLLFAHNDVDWSVQPERIRGLTAYYVIDRLLDGEDTFDMDFRRFGKEDLQARSDRIEETAGRIRVEGQELTLEVPYSDLTLRSGSVVRVMLREDAGGTVDERLFFPEVRTTLR